MIIIERKSVGIEILVVPSSIIRFIIYITRLLYELRLENSTYFLSKLLFYFNFIDIIETSTNKEK